MVRREELVAEVRRLMRRWWSEPGEPPTPDELLAYRDGELPPADSARIADEIARHPEARRALDALAAFPDLEPLPGEEPLSDAELEEEWQRFQDRLDSSSGTSSGAATEFVVPRGGPAPSTAPSTVPALGSRARRQAWRWPAAAAAAAALLAGAGGWWAGRGGAAGPSASVAVVHLAPAGSTVQRSAAPGGEPAAGAERLVLFLASAEPPREGDYGVTITAEDGRRLWSVGDARPDRTGIFRLDLPGDFLSTGSYRIRVTPPGGGPPTLYELDLAPP